MTVKIYKRLELAENQLETAIGLFISGGDKFSAITLAGAADVILSRLVMNAGQENFTEFCLREESTTNSDFDETTESFGRKINDMLFINDLKHMDDDEDIAITLDARECALTAILKAMANYVILAGKEKDFVKAFLAWVRLNLDPDKYNINCDPNWKATT